VRIDSTRRLHNCTGPLIGLSSLWLLCERAFSGIKTTSACSIFNHLQPCLRIPLELLQTESIQLNNSAPLISIITTSAACRARVKLDCVRVTWFDRVDKASVTVIAVGALSRSDALFAAPLLAPQLTDCQVAPEAGLAWLGWRTLHSLVRLLPVLAGAAAAASPLINCRHRTYTRTHTHERATNAPTHPQSFSLNQSVLFWN